MEAIFAAIPGLSEALTAEVPDPRIIFPSTPSELATLAKAWVLYNNDAEAGSTVDRMVRELPPFEALGLIRELAVGASAAAIGCLGVGPLEDLLAAHGAILIGAVEEAALLHDNFRSALQQVWRRGMPEDIWLRVLAAGQPYAT